MLRNKLFAVILILSFCFTALPQTHQNFQLLETTIAKVHQAYRSGELTAHQLVEMYLKRIKEYDQSTRLNSIVVLNEHALATADSLDALFKKTGKLLPLQGIPILVKDNFDTYDLQTAGGSLAMKSSIPPDDAYQVEKLREAGAIILGKTNMAEWAFSNVVTISSIAELRKIPTI